MVHAALTLIALLCLLSASALAEGGGAIRDRIRDRIADKITEKPAPVVNAHPGKVITAPGDYTFKITHGGLDRFYQVHVPRGYRAGAPTPLVVALHGGGGHMGYMARDDLYSLITQSDQTGTIVAFPNGYSKFKSGYFATWNAGACCGDARDQNIDDVGFIKTMLENLLGQFSIDRARVFVTGMSNGGLMAYRLACEIPDMIAAIAPVAGTDNTLVCPPGAPVSVLHIHARDDTHVLFDGGAGKDSFRDPSKVTDFKSVPATIAKWTGRNQCPASTPPATPLDVPGATCTLYAPCAGGTRVQLCVTETGGHSWPGGSKPRGDTPPSAALSANDMMWRFFNRQ